ncbi:hypothetical protein ACFQ2B_13140 [Streptomyces stramineus]|uniref:MarR family transcriptional regulator n=1 Tax=Streptomyces stramineus TaxID=173861 RepID=A0ABN1AV11_9ACTN
MASVYPNAGAPSAQPHPTASPGYGKRSAPGQAPRSRSDFAHLPAREASIATFVDRLPDGAAMDAKTLAAHIPAYGQAACRTAVKRLSEAGHLRRVREHRKSDSGSLHWVTRTYFSRTPRDDAWWNAFLKGDVPGAGTGAVPPVAARPARSAAYDALASTGRADPRMTLSASDCRALEELAGEWLARGSTPADLVRELTAGLPPVVHHAASLARNRLTAKMPPEPLAAPAPAAAPLRVMECTVCRTPGRPEALPGGLCRDCRGEPRREFPQGIPPGEIHRRVAAIRAAVRTTERSIR